MFSLLLVSGLENYLRAGCLNLIIQAMISNSLRSGQPLPQITPCPLLDRFMARQHGLNVIHQESEDDLGLPRTLTMDTLQNEQYL
jgi:hypothetical protein